MARSITQIYDTMISEKEMMVQLNDTPPQEYLDWKESQELIN